MNIQVNGEPQEVAGPLTISALLAQLNIEPRRVAVEHNLVVIKRHLYDATVVEDGDTIEIVNLVGGGAADSQEIRRDSNRRAGDQEAGIIV